MVQTPPMRPLRPSNKTRSVWFSTSAFAALCGIWMAGCCFGGGTPTPDPTPPITNEPAEVPGDQVLISVSASSQPVGASVTGGGALLGQTPFTTQVPVPRPQPGQAQSFEFTFQLPGYQSQTITASPVNNTLTLNVLLQPDVPVAVVGTEPGGEQPGVTQVAGTGTPGQVFTVRSRGGGPITDFSQARATATVPTGCVMGGLSIDIDGSHSYFTDLAVSLEGPDGTNYSIQRRGRANPFRTHTVRRARGHASAGNWVLTVADQVQADSGSLRGFTMTVTCQ